MRNLVILLTLILVGCGSESKSTGSNATSVNTVPTAVIDVDVVEGNIPLKVNFSGQKSYDPEDEKLKYIWSFGDGAKATGKNVQHTYKDRGRYPRCKL